MKTITNQESEDLNLFDKESLKDTQVQTNIKTWIEALKSGEYKQGKYLLNNNNKYCCLGVADKVCKLNEEDPESLYSSHKSVGLVDDEGVMKGNKDCLSNLNDEKDWNFEEIANLLQNQFDLLTK
jgi:hypothetical protein